MAENEGTSVHDAVNQLSEKFAAMRAGENLEPEVETVEVVEIEESEVEAEPEEVIGEVEEGVEETEEVVETEEPEAEEERSFSHISELLEAGAVDPSKLAVTVKINGEERDVNLQEAIWGYQRQADYDRHMTEIRETKAELQSAKENVLGLPEVQERLQVFEDAFRLAASVINAEQSALEQAYQSTDWAKLRAENQAEYAVRQADYTRQAQEIQRRQQQLYQSYEEAKNEQNRDQEQRFNKVRSEQRSRLMERAGWNEGEFETRLDEIGTYLRETYGATDQEWGNLIDHRILDIARKAHAYDQLQANGKKIVKETKRGTKVKNRTLRPGAHKPKVPKAAERRAALDAREKLSQTHSAADAADALKARWQST